MEPSANGIERYPLWRHDDRVASNEETATPIDTGAISTMSVSMQGSFVRQMFDPESDSEVDKAIVRLTRMSAKEGQGDTFLRIRAAERPRNPLHPPTGSRWYRPRLAAARPCSCGLSTMVHLS